MSTRPTRRGSTAALRHLIPYDRVWRICDAKGQVLGRLAGQLARVLQGKHKPYYFDNMFCGDPIVVINARHFDMTERKPTNKVYYRHSGYPGGLKTQRITTLLEKRPTVPLRRAVYNMLPRNRLRKIWLDNLKIYPDEHHPHGSINLVPLPRNHVSKRLGMGGPPTLAELEQWWIDNIQAIPQHDLDAIIDEVRREAAEREPPAGLAQLLVPDPTAEDDAARDEAKMLSPPEREALAAYIAAAEADLAADPVFVPTLPH